MTLDHYVGRAVRLNQRAYAEVVRRFANHGITLENLFVVSGISHGVRKLVCYGANLRLTVDPGDVVLV